MTTLDQVETGLSAKRSWLQSKPKLTEELHGPEKTNLDRELSKSDGSRLQFLDLLRAVALALVLCAHLLHVSRDTLGYHWLVIWKLQQIGWCGVDLFFVLSGFLVGGLLWREYQIRKGVNPGRFLVRRAFKIYPPFYVLLVATL